LTKRQEAILPARRQKMRHSARSRAIAFIAAHARKVYFSVIQCHAICRFPIKIRRFFLALNRMGVESRTFMAIDLKRLNQAQLNELIQRAETRKQEINRENAGKVRAKLAALAKAEGFTIEELFGTRGRQGKGTRRKAKPKYRNPADHAQTWSGRGKRPRWFNAALSAGKKEKDLLI
jgi:DNA-binding protein H-NS